LKPIPKRLLKNNVSYVPYIADNGEGAGYGTSVILNNVRIEEMTQLSQSKDGNEVVGNAMLFYDFINSSGLTSTPTNHSKIIFNGRTYHIVSTDILRKDANPHHYEILLK
jgi:hypothetical protein